MTSPKVIFHNNIKIMLMHICTTYVFVAATDRVQAVVEGRCAPVVTHEDGDQSRVPPGSMEW